jgi:hypothetical protein
LALVAAGIALHGMQALYPAAAQAPATLPAQTPIQKPAATPAHQAGPQHKRPGAKPSPSTPAPAPAAAALPVAPPAPNWPANDKAVAATVVWDSHGLSIVATNSSLIQILKDISAATGAKVEGLGVDERIFGTYGPGQARDVISQLLDGSGYNVLMIGDQGEGTPRQIVLSNRPNGPAPAAPNGRNSGNEEETEAEPPQQQPEPSNIRNGLAPGMPRSSELQQMEQRRQQQQQQQNNPQ